jgi:hypothetical protein
MGEHDVNAPMMQQVKTNPSGDNQNGKLSMSLPPKGRRLERSDHQSIDVNAFDHRYLNFQGELKEVVQRCQERNAISEVCIADS